MQINIDIFSWGDDVFVKIRHLPYYLWAEAQSEVCAISKAKRFLDDEPGGMPHNPTFVSNRWVIIVSVNEQAFSDRHAACNEIAHILANGVLEQSVVTTVCHHWYEAFLDLVKLGNYGSKFSFQTLNVKIVIEAIKIPPSN